MPDRDLLAVWCGASRAKVPLGREVPAMRCVGLGVSGGRSKHGLVFQRLLQDGHVLKTSLRLRILDPGLGDRRRQQKRDPGVVGPHNVAGQHHLLDVLGQGPKDEGRVGEEVPQRGAA